jgi:hypothetical protein
VPKSGSLGSARGALSNGRPYREHHGYVAVRPKPALGRRCRHADHAPKRPTTMTAAGGAAENAEFGAMRMVELISFV